MDNYIFEKEYHENFNEENSKKNKSFFLDSIVAEFISEENEEFFPLILCFGKNHLALINGDNFRMIQEFSFNENNIGFTMNTCYKVFFFESDLYDSSSTTNKFSFILANQSNKSNIMFSKFSLCF